MRILALVGLAALFSCGSPHYFEVRPNAQMGETSTDFYGDQIDAVGHSYGVVLVVGWNWGADTRIRDLAAQVREAIILGDGRVVPTTITVEGDEAEPAARSELEVMGEIILKGTDAVTKSDWGAGRIAALVTVLLAVFGMAWLFLARRKKGG